MVGDEFQSIYGFRHADLDVFRRQRELIEQRADAELMELSGNFRSRPELIAAVNLFGAALLGAAYRPLRVGAPPPSAEPRRRAGRAVELLLTARDGWDEEGIELEPAIDGAHAAQLPGRGALPSPRACASWPTQGSTAARWSCCCAPSPTSTPTRTRSSAPACAPTWSAAAATGPSSRSPTSARCWRRSPTRSTTRRSSAPSPRPPAAPPRTRSGCCARRPGRRRHVWPALERAAGAGEAELAEPERLEQIPAAELRAAARASWRRSAPCASAAPRLSLAGLIEAATTETGYDLAVLMRPAGEARFANVRKLMRLAAEFESREGRDLRGLLDFLAARAESDAEAQAATAAEGHDGVRIMTVHNAKGSSSTSSPSPTSRAACWPGRGRRC